MNLASTKLFIYGLFNEAINSSVSAGCRERTQGQVKNVFGPLCTGRPV